MTLNNALTAAVAALTVVMMVAGIFLVTNALRTSFDVLEEHLQFICHPGSAYTVKECP